jgi:hypothetical protein
MNNRSIFLAPGTRTKVSKTRGRKGSLLILVMVIMAVALILITSAMTITVAARTHYNKTAVMDQSNLTAMSAAKMIGTAVEKGTISGTQLENMAAAGTVYNLSASNTVSPGLANNSNSNTTATFSSTTIAGTSYIAIDVTTYINNTSVVGGGSSQTVRLLLQKVITADNGAFVNQLTAGPGSVDFTNVDVGAVPTGTTAVSPAVVTYGNVMYAGGGSATFESDVIVMGRLTSSAGIVFKKNLIIWQDASIAADYGSGMTIGGSLLVLGKSGTNTPLFTDSSLNASPLTSAGGTTAAGGMYFINKMFESSMNTTTFDSSAGTVWDTNTTAKYPQNTSIPSSYILADSTAVLTVGGVSTGTHYTDAQKPIIKTLRDLVANNYTSVQLSASTSRSILTTAQAYKNLLGLDASAVKTGSVLASAAGAKNLANLNGVNVLQLQYGSSKKITTLSANDSSAFYIDTAGSVLANKTLGTTGGYNGNDNNYSKVVFDLQYGPITLYIIDSDGGNNGTFTIGNGLIQFINGNPTQGKIGKILLLDGTDIDTTIGGNGCPYDTGIIGTDHVTNSSITPRTTVKTLGTSVPYLYIYGFENNLIQVRLAVTMEGYIGLYGTNGKISFFNTQKFNNLPLIYCRVEACNFSNINGSILDMTYCPPPTTSSTSSSTGSTYVVAGYVTQ